MQEGQKTPKTAQFLVYGSFGHIACAYGFPHMLLIWGPPQDNIHL